ncbi:unnamed protein product [Cladocopium goreaui]|nr:unnamed protein product [Cladocopium goreaui]|mmetsp:Transcript_10840/g.23878  ORF Transcript_10840/g.23878 Transcript_10840/m.23878 type:complete len:198 (-) Transcript_10840:37-630(-)
MFLQLEDDSAPEELAHGNGTPELHCQCLHSGAGNPFVWQKRTYGSTWPDFEFHRLDAPVDAGAGYSTCDLQKMDKSCSTDSPDWNGVSSFTRQIQKQQRRLTSGDKQLLNCYRIGYAFARIFPERWPLSERCCAQQHEDSSPVHFNDKAISKMHHTKSYGWSCADEEEEVRPCLGANSGWICATCSLSDNAKEAESF